MSFGAHAELRLFLFVEVLALRLALATLLLLAGLLLRLALTLLASLLTALLLAGLLLRLSLLTLALAALTGTIHVISHGKFSALVDRGCAPRSEPPRTPLVPGKTGQNVRFWLKFCCS